MTTRSEDGEGAVGPRPGLPTAGWDHVVGDEAQPPMRSAPVRA